MSNDLILCLDLGTQSARASLIDEHGEIVALSKEKYDPLYLDNEPGVCEQNPDTYFEYIVKAIKSIRQKIVNLVDDIKGCVVTTFRDTAVFLDKDNKVLRPCILWLDQRIATKIKPLPLYQKFLFKMVGMSSFVRFQRMKTAAHWVKQYQRDIYDKTKKYVNISTYINYCLTGNLTDTVASVVGHYPIDYKKASWYSKHSIKSKVFDIDKSTYCELKKPGEIIGYLKPEILSMLGATKPIPLFGSGSDKSLECLGNGCIDSSLASISYGTASTVAITSKKYVEPSPFLPAYTSAQNGSYNSELQVYRGFWMLNWFKNECCKDETKDFKSDHELFDYLDEKIKDIPPGSEGLVLQPYWGPCLERPNARGSIVGFSERHTKYHIFRAIIEGIGFALREGMERIEKKEPGKVNALVVSGGGSHSNVILQITADIFNLPVYQSITTETSSLGAAMVGFMAINKFASYEECKKSMVKYKNVFYPDKKKHEQYEYIYRNVYLKLYPSLKKVYGDIRAVVNEKF